MENENIKWREKYESYNLLDKKMTDVFQAKSDPSTSMFKLSSKAKSDVAEKMRPAKNKPSS